MQQPICKLFGVGMDSVQNLMHLESEVNDDMFNDSWAMTSDSEDNRNSSDEHNINLSTKSSQDFGLEYWINHTNPRLPSPLPCTKPDKSVFISKSKSGIKCKDASLSSSSSYQMPKKSKKQTESLPKSQNHTDSSQLKSTKLKYKDYDIPRLKIPKHVLKNYLKTLSPNNSSQSSSSESEPSFFPSQNEKSRKRSKLKSKRNRQRISESSSSSSAKRDSSCLEKSFENSNYSTIKSNCPLSATSHDLLHLTLKIDQTVYSGFSTLSRNISRSAQCSETEKYFPPNGNEATDSKHAENLPSTDIKFSKTRNPLFYPESNCDSLSYSCDIKNEEKKSVFDSFREENQRLFQNDIVCKQVNKTPSINSRKRSLDSLSDEDQDSVVSVKRKPLQPCPINDGESRTEPGDKPESDMTPIDFIRFLTARLKKYENVICEKYCLSQPNAMKFLAQNHATNWESNKNILHQMHLVPCEFLNEIFHRALHCYGLEKKIVKETMNGNTSPMYDHNTSHSTEYKKIRDEYSFSLKRVRYGIGVIDELFRRKVNYQNVPQNNDVPIVRKWKHIIYYLCLHAKSAFMAKEIQYDNYVQSASTSFDCAMDTCSSSTPSVRSIQNINHEMYNKPQLPKESMKLFDTKFPGKSTPEHCSHSDLEVSPHSYDSGKGSSIRMSSSSNTNTSLISHGCHTTSSLNSTPHSIIQQQDSPLNLPGFQLYRIDEYQSTANEYIRLLPDAGQLHRRIVDKIGTEPNANSRENMVKLIYYVDIVQTLSREDLFNDCLQRLLSQASSRL